MAIELNEGQSIVETTKDGSKKYEHGLKQLNFCDRRVYQRSEGVYYPSVTTILTASPVDPFLIDWLKTAGKNADWARDKAAREGTAVHQALEDLVAGKKLEWADKWGNAKYSLLVWQMILKGANFLQTYKPEVLASEMFLYSDKYQYAGTTDLLVRMDDKVWLLDWKTSTTVGLNYHMQTAAYAKALEELKGIHVDKCGIVWLKAATRGPRKGSYQGDGWQLIDSGDIEKNFEAFLKIYDVYKIYNPKIEPYNKTYPTEIQLKC